MRDIPLHELEKMKREVLQQLSESLERFINIFKKVKKDLKCGEKEREHAAVVITTLLMGMMENLTDQISSINTSESNEVH